MVGPTDAVLFAFSLDFVATLVFPLFVLGYSVAHFDVDRPALHMLNEYVPANMFDSTARYFADPVAISKFKAGFDSTRLFTWLGVAVRLGQNLVFCGRVLFALDSTERVLAQGRAVQEAFNAQKRIPKWVGALVLAYVPVLLAYSVWILEQAKVACAPYAGCKRFGYRFVWTTHVCPCIDFVDRQVSVRTFDEWLAPVDVTDDLRSAAGAATLMTVSLVNRKLEELPSTLRHCDNLRELYVQQPRERRVCHVADTVHNVGRSSTQTCKRFPTGPGARSPTSNTCG